MILKAIDGAKFELTISGYQFPEIRDDEWDSNWLLISVRIHDEMHIWGATDPCMDTYEAHDLCRWLHSLLNPHDITSEMAFLEPELRFKLTGILDGKIELEIKCRYNLAPLNTTRSYNYERLFQFSMDKQAISQAANEWCDEIQTFPTRIQRGK